MPGSGEHLTRRQKLCFVGDSRCGKTCLLTTTTKGSFPEAYEPTTFENYVSDVDVSNIGRMELEIWDTAGQEIYDNLRALSYPDSQALVLCFSIGDPLSYHNLLEKWLPEATRFCPETPIFVIGCKQDLRFDPKTIGELQRCGQLPLTTAEGLAAAGRIGARYYMETSAKSGYGVDNLLVIIAEEIQRTRQLEPITNLARRFHEDARVINEERRNFRATGEILTPREKDYASRYVRIMDEPSSTVWKLQEEQVVDKAVNASRTSFFRKSS
ncbi:P-loop containing nucleoside triphosphate hydrolase protein [Podospora aff. communis PSN243]|uniref:P-loop containing nucleoside triphosphate hydrolase protein n=1 Tax=Podospora aff. communis PSN243 TaxID=3040156 RepID=A0AAV9GSI5_9PEZI|nr:P-loop containing nucleoside triphosphate hydrolase protein [Podospora aff. communis PSN243]